MSQLHKRFNDGQVKELFDKYIRGEVERKYLQEILGIGKSRFFVLMGKYRTQPGQFSVQYERNGKTRGISSEIERTILKELSREKKLIADDDTPIRTYNYSYIRDILKQDYGQIVSLPTIIDRAKRNGFYLKKRKKEKIHDREVLTNYIGELIQHDSSIHKWSPYADKKWTLITSLDDYSRFMPYANLVETETSMAHINALESVFLHYGTPLSYYSDSHSIFRFVQGRDSVWRKHYLLTDGADTQWKQVLNECGVKIIYALSPQAKGKIERPYGWLQDRVVRSCARENIKEIKAARLILGRELHRYNFVQVHSTTGEIPYNRFKRAAKEKRSLFRPFGIKPPFKSTKDIFCLRLRRTIDAYRRVSIGGFVLKVNGVPHNDVELRIYPLNNLLAEVRFWCGEKLIDIQKVKISDLGSVHF